MIEEVEGGTASGLPRDLQCAVRLSRAKQGCTLLKSFQKSQRDVLHLKGQGLGNRIWIELALLYREEVGAGI